MKKVTLFAAGLLIASTSFGQWSLDKAHSRLGFSVEHMKISETDGNFKDFDVKLASAKSDFSDAAIELTADANTVNTDMEARDKHLRSADFFDVEKNPTISFKSKSFKKVSGKQYKLTGDFTMHGVTKPVTLDAVFNGTTVNPMSKKTMAGFTVTGIVKRSEYALAATTPEALLGENVKLRANLEFSKD
ncbi:MAG: YceI family protein [Taibaiella sp.]|nr:YceI family protein [Taibaiella sp.]